MFTSICTLIYITVKANHTIHNIICKTLFFFLPISIVGIIINTQLQIP